MPLFPSASAAWASLGLHRCQLTFKVEGGGEVAQDSQMMLVILAQHIPYGGLHVKLRSSHPVGSERQCPASCWRPGLMIATRCRSCQSLVTGWPLQGVDFVKFGHGMAGARHVPCTGHNTAGTAWRGAVVHVRAAYYLVETCAVAQDVGHSSRVPVLSQQAHRLQSTSLRCNVSGLGWFTVTKSRLQAPHHR